MTDPMMNFRTLVEKTPDADILREMTGAVRATMITSLQPVFATLCAGVMLEEFLTGWQWFGIVVVVAALVMRDLDKAAWTRRSV